MPDVTVKVKTLDSNTHSFTISDSLSVQQFKASIESTVGVTGNQQRLIYCGKVLVDDKLLSEYDLNGKTVHLVVRAPPSHAGPSTSTASSADDSGNLSGRHTSSTGRTETNQQVVGAWYLPSAFDPAGIQSMVQGVISNLGDLGRNATVLSNEDGSAVDVRINLSHLPNAPATIAANVGHAAAAAVWPPSMHAADANPSIIQHHFTPLTSTVPLRVFNNPTIHPGTSDPNAAHIQQLQVNLRVNLIKSRLTIIQSEFQEIQRLSQQPSAPPSEASASASSQTSEATAASDSRSDEAPMETSTPSAPSESAHSFGPSVASSSSAGLDVAARAASAAASAAETAAIYARQAAATLEAAIYSHRSRQQSGATQSSATVRLPPLAPVAIPPLAVEMVPISIDIESMQIPSPFTGANVRASSSSSSTSQAASSDAASHGQDAPASEPQRRVTADKFADLLRSVRQAESKYHQQLVVFEESLRSPYNSSLSNRNVQIQSLLHRVRHQLVLINNTLSEISVDFTSPELPVVVQAMPVDTLSPPMNSRASRSSSTSRSPNNDGRPASDNSDSRSAANNSNAPPSQQRRTVLHTARVTATPHHNSLSLGASTTPLALYGGYRFPEYIPAPTLTHRLVFTPNARGQERSDETNRNAASATSHPPTSQQTQQQQQQHTGNTESVSDDSSAHRARRATSVAATTISTASQSTPASPLNSGNISTSNWQSAVAPAWVPVIANDLTRQQSETNSSGTAFSDAYLNGLPKKKRRTDQDGSSGGN